MDNCKALLTPRTPSNAINAGLDHMKLQVQDSPATAAGPVVWPLDLGPVLLWAVFQSTFGHAYFRRSGRSAGLSHATDADGRNGDAAVWGMTAVLFLALVFLATPAPCG